MRNRIIILMSSFAMLSCSVWAAPTQSGKPSQTLPCAPPGIPVYLTSVGSAGVRMAIEGTGEQIDTMLVLYAKPEAGGSPQEPDFVVVHWIGAFVASVDDRPMDTATPPWIDPGVVTENGRQARATRVQTCRWQREQWAR